MRAAQLKTLWLTLGLILFAAPLMLCLPIIPNKNSNKDATKREAPLLTTVLPVKANDIDIKCDLPENQKSFFAYLGNQSNHNNTKDAVSKYVGVDAKKDSQILKTNMSQDATEPNQCAKPLVSDEKNPSKRDLSKNGESKDTVSKYAGTDAKQDSKSMKTGMTKDTQRNEYTKPLPLGSDEKDDNAIETSTLLETDMSKETDSNQINKPLRFDEKDEKDDNVNEGVKLSETDMSKDTERNQYAKSLESYVTDDNANEISKLLETDMSKDTEPNQGTERLISQRFFGDERVNNMENMDNMPVGFDVKRKATQAEKERLLLHQIAFWPVDRSQWEVEKETVANGPNFFQKIKDKLFALFHGRKIILVKSSASSSSCDNDDPDEQNAENEEIEHQDDQTVDMGKNMWKKYMDKMSRWRNTEKIEIQKHDQHLNDNDFEAACLSDIYQGKNIMMAAL